ncbi:MAG: nucleotidyltransferase domain-containing protein [Clostridiales bacterium]|nr:nucleotidyltransferase domain-containing protein [Clostridiales bacterium]
MMENLSKVNSLKRNQIEQVITSADRSGVVRRLIVFGSSVTDYCTQESDVDLCFDTTCNIEDRRIFDLIVDADKACEYNCDILFYNDLRGKIKQEVDQKGEIVYEAR